MFPSFRPAADAAGATLDRPVRADPVAAAAIARLPVARRAAADGVLAGAHRGGRGGFSVEFVGHRPFRPGDDPRRIDWRKRPAAGRAGADGWFVKQFESETGLAVHLVGDASAGMALRGPAADGGEGSHPSKWRFAAAAAATLADAVLRRRDAVSLTITGRGGVVLPASSAPAHATAVCEALSVVRPAGAAEVDWPAELAAATGRWGRRGVALILSDFLTEPDRLFAALSDLRRRGHEAALLRVLAPAEVAFPFPSPRRFRPLSGGPPVPGGGATGRAAYLEAFGVHAGLLGAACRRAGVPLCTARTDEPLADALVRLLVGRGGRL